MLEEDYREDEAIEAVLKENDAFETEVQILFQAVGDKYNFTSVKETFDSESLLFDYFNECDIKQSHHKLEDGDLTGEFEILWVGKIDRDCLTDELVNDLVRLTHHAEFLYEDTGAEYVHVEVCIDGKWYGREEKDMSVDGLIASASQRFGVQNDNTGKSKIEKEFE